MNPERKPGVIAHRVEGKELLRKALAYRVERIEIDVQLLRGIDFWKEDLRVRHGNGPFPHPFYPRLRDVVATIPLDLGVLLDLKPRYRVGPIVHAVEPLLQKLVEEERRHIAVTTGGLDVFDRVPRVADFSKPLLQMLSRHDTNGLKGLQYLAREFPQIEVLYPVNSLEDIMELERITGAESVSVRSSLLKTPSIKEQLKGKRIYVWGATFEEENQLLQEGNVAGIITDRYKLDASLRP